MMPSLSIWGYLVILIIIFLIVISLFKRQGVVEGFVQSDSFVLKSGPAVYDGFYSDIYDHLVFNTVKNDYEIGAIINSTKPTYKSVILDVGSGTGHHVGTLKAKGYNVTGIDMSQFMVEKAKENYPNCTFQQKNVLESSIFQHQSFTHILCMYFTIYNIQNKEAFFKNAFNWLTPGGYCVVHLVERDKFDPILPPGNPILFGSIQKHAEKRITSTKIKFTDFSYSANFKTPSSATDEKCTFEEKFTNDDNGKTRKNEHILYMVPIPKIVDIAEKQGFLSRGKIDLKRCQYDYQYLYIFMKPKAN